jgi:hypothetical protein
MMTLHASIPIDLLRNRFAALPIDGHVLGGRCDESSMELRANRLPLLSGNAAHGALTHDCRHAIGDAL